MSVFDSFFDQVDRDLVIQEATYGFVMALTFVTATQLGMIDMEASLLVKSIIAMDFVWGAIDLIIFFNMDVIAARRRRHDLARIYAGESESPEEEMYGMLDGTIFEELDDESRRKAVEAMSGGHFVGCRMSASERHKYLFNAVTAFLVTFLTALPSAFCILLIEDMWFACLCAASVSCLSLFFTGYLMAVSESKLIRFAFGLSLTIVTMVLTLFAAYFGG